MAVEPLGSIMSMQAQAAQSKQTVSVPRAVPEHTDPEVMENSRIDNTINFIKNTKDKGNANEETPDERQSPSNSQAANEQMKKAVEKLNKNLSNSEAIFGIHEATHRVTIKIIDKTTKEVLKELPPEKTLDMLVKVWELAGILVDEKR